jgi:N-acetyl sugar amidotransferase
VTAYRRCTRCVMDTTDPDIRFDEAGVCSWCHRHDRLMAALPATPEERRAALERRVERIRADGRGRPYDCIIGLSGGVDSTYVAHLVKEHGLRPLAVHMDSGWNSEIAVSNIEAVVKVLGIDLFTFVVDWEEMRDLQLSFLRASVVNCDIPQDHAFMAVLYRMAAKHGIRHVVSGHNIATESILPLAWRGHSSKDLWYLKNVHRRHGTVPLRRYPTYSVLDVVYARFVRRVQFFQVLNLVEYDKPRVKEFIARELGWRDYGGKHYESMWTRFFQSYYLVRKFGFDKRLAHLSNLVLSGGCTRDEALAELREPAYDPAEAAALCDFVANKLRITPAELARLVGEAPSTHAFRSYENSLAGRARRFLPAGFRI